MRSLSGVKMSADLAHMHSVMKFMASWLMSGVLRSPPVIMTKRTRGIQVGVVVVVGA